MYCTTIMTIDFTKINDYDSVKTLEKQSEIDEPATLRVLYTFIQNVKINSNLIMLPVTHTNYFSKNAKKRKTSKIQALSTKDSILE